MEMNVLRDCSLQETLHQFEVIFSKCSNDNLQKFESELAKICPQNEVGTVAVKAGCKANEGSFSISLFIRKNQSNLASNLITKVENILNQVPQDELNKIHYVLGCMLDKNPTQVQLNFLFPTSLENEIWAFQFSGKIL